MNYEARRKDTETFTTHVIDWERTDNGWRITTPLGCIDVPRSSPDAPAPWVHAPVLCYGREFNFIRGLVIGTFIYFYDTPAEFEAKLMDILKSYK